MGHMQPPSRNRGKAKPSSCYSPHVSATSTIPKIETARHSALVRVTHWITTIAFLALLLTGLELVISHPRFYWGETGNSNMKPLFSLHIPASRDTVPTGYQRVMPDENGWSRYLHFEAAWVAILTGLVYGIYGFWSGHFLRDLIPTSKERSWRAFWGVIAKYLRRGAREEDEFFAYNVAQKSAYLVVIFILFPLIVWTGLALSPSFNSAFPWFVDVLGGRQSARTLHFFITGFLVLFLVVHVTMVAVGGFKARMRAMITGRGADSPGSEQERP